MFFVVVVVDSFFFSSLNSLPLDTLKISSGAQWYDLGRHQEHGKSTVRGEICLRLKFVRHTKADKGIARARRLGGSIGKASSITTKQSAVVQKSSPLASASGMVQTAGKSARKGRQKPVKPV